jgi:NAD(P)H dehydrogenase (quinone)
MNVFIVYAHPSEDSLTRHIRDSFIAGLKSAGHSYILSDLYKMNFKTDMDEAEYLREAYYRMDLSVSADIATEHEKINASDAIVFIYPLFWSDAPAKMVGWFNRVWTYGFAYGDAGGPGQGGRNMKQLEKGLVLCIAGNTMEYFHKTGILSALEKVMLEDRLFDRVTSKELILFDAASRELESRKAKWEEHLERAFQAGKTIDLFGNFSFRTNSA